MSLLLWPNSQPNCVFSFLILRYLSETFNTDDSSIFQPFSPHFCQDTSLAWFPFCFPNLSFSLFVAGSSSSIWPLHIGEISTLPSVPPSHPLFLGDFIQSHGFKCYLHAHNRSLPLVSDSDIQPLT